MHHTQHKFLIGLLTPACLLGSAAVHAQQLQDPWQFILTEQRSIEIRDPSQLRKAARIPMVSRPPTVADPQFDAPPRNLSLSEAINTGLANLDVVRVLAGVTAVSRGQTVYDVAITNNQIDQQQSAFDPNLRTDNGWSRNESPSAVFDPLDPTRSIITGGRSDGYAFDFGLSKRTVTGGVIDFRTNSNDRSLLGARLCTNRPLDPRATSQTIAIR